MEVIRTGRSQLHEQIAATFLSEYACDGCSAPTQLQQAGPRSAILVPLVLHSDVVGVITFVRAATRRRFGRDDLLLADEIARRAASAVDNARLYRRAQAAIGLRDEFLSVAAHERKTPLTSLQLQLDSLAKDVERTCGGDEKTRWFSTSALRQTARLTRLVDELLDVSRITSGRVVLHPEPCDLAELVRTAAAMFEAQAARKGSRIELQLAETPVRGNWDRARIEQVVVNLLGNALKYGAGRPVRVALEASDASARLSVRDEGIGIAENDIPRIFDRFERAASPRQYGGLGLGLFIAREIVAAHGGDIEVRSRPDQGSEFVVRLPTRE